VLGYIIIIIIIIIILVVIIIIMANTDYTLTLAAGESVWLVLHSSHLYFQRTSLH
jgi:hypothetical protein